MLFLTYCVCVCVIDAMTADNCLVHWVEPVLVSIFFPLPLPPLPSLKKNKHRFLGRLKQGGKRNIETFYLSFSELNKIHYYGSLGFVIFKIMHEIFIGKNIH